MKIPKLLMPAVTLAGALALAGCGGGSDAPANPGGGGNGGGDKPADCSAAGVIPDPDNENACIPDPDYVDPAAASKERTANAKALMTAFTTGSGVIGTNLQITGLATTPNTVTLKPSSKTVAALAGWQGKRYEGENGTGDDKITAEAVAYSNQGTAETQPFGDLYRKTEDRTHYIFGDTDADTGTLSRAPADIDRIVINGLDSDGRQSVNLADKFSGSYNGASGDYVCAAATCTVDTSGGKVSELTAAGWQFTPAAGATVPKTSAYLQFGWWVSKDKDSPTETEAFARPQGGTVAGISGGNISNVVGTATYKGAAAGKFAISDSARPTGDSSGHFTADAELKADFKAAGTAGTLEGTIDNFTLNDTTKGPWVVKLESHLLASTGIDSDVTTTETRWSLNGDDFAGKVGSENNAGGGWSATFYENEGDDNNIPDSVIGTFGAAVGSTHRMEGAFGASQE